MSADADLLCRAEKLMRERAEAADTGEVWEHEKRYDLLRTVFFKPSVNDDDLDGFDMPSVCVAGRPQADHIASWHPAVALAVADLLRVVDEAPSVPQHAVIVSALDCREVLARIRIAVDVIARVYLREVES